MQMTCSFLDFHQPHVVAIQETKIDSSIATSELFPETCPYSVYRKDRNIHGGGVMLLVHKDISHMPITELENDSESIWVKVFANKTSHFVASWYRPPGSTSEEFQLFREQLDYIRTHHKGKKLPSAHVLGDFNFKDIDWPDRLSKSGSTLSQSEGQILIDIMNDHGLEQMVHFPTREKNTLDLILTTLPGQFQDVHSPDKLSDHDIVSGTLKMFIPPIKKPRRKVYLYQKGDYESMRKDTLQFAKEKYFNGHSDTRSVQENFDLLTSFIQDSADKHIPSKTSRSLTCAPCKLLEHIVCSNIMAHLDEYKLLSDRQHAFRKGHSCETQLTTVINDWAKILDNRGQVDTFILDFEKAFDIPPHELLKSKLFGYGIGGKTLKWIDSFLCFRQQRVVVNGVKSDWAPVLSGVPQGTVLGPLLFSLYINDILSDIESEIRLFADDCVCYREIKDEKDTMKLQRDIDRLGSWARKWGMRFQPVKCNMMQLTRKRIKKIHASYTLEGTNLEKLKALNTLE